MRIKWLHLSDIHFNYKNYNSKLLREDFLKTIKSLNESEPFTHLFLSGDILYRYNKADSATTEFIKSIIKSMNISVDNVFVIPGNHDHDRTCAIQVISKACDRANNEKIDLIDAIDVIDLDSQVQLLKSFLEFDNVYQNIFHKSYYDNYDNPHQIVSNGEMTILKLNTAWLDKDSGDTNVYCGSNNLSDLLLANEEILKNRLNIAIGHHPIEAFTDEDRIRILDLFKRFNIGIYFCGHQHKPSICHFFDEDILQFTCPGGYNDKYTEGGYVWGILDTECSFYKAEFYIWDNGKWCIDSRLKGTDERGIFYFNSKKHKHNSQIAAVDIKMFDGHIARQEIEDSIGCSDFDIHTYNANDVFDWSFNEGNIEAFSSDIKYLIEKNEKVHIYPLAPIPLLIKLGFELQNNSRMIIHQYDRHNKKWVYDEDEDITLKINKNISDKKCLVVKISTSALINEKLIKETLPDRDFDVIEFEASQIALGLPLYNKTIVDFAKKISNTLNGIVSEYNSIHIFAAIPAGLAIEIGRNLLKSIYHNVYTYNLSTDKYEKAFVLNSTKTITTKGKESFESNVVLDSDISHNIVYLPILGKVACSDLSEAILESNETFPISSTVLGSGEYFVLVASGNSMIDAGINDGDMVIIRVQNTADNGQIVLARVDNEVTLKRLIRDDDKRIAILHPENSLLEDLEYKDFEIQGVAIKVIKSLK